MVAGKAYGGRGELSLPFIEIVHDSASDDLTLSTVLQPYVWSRVAFDTTNGDLTFDGVDEVTCVTAGDYRVEAWITWLTSLVSRTTALMELDPLGVGAYAFIINSPLYGDSEGALVSSSRSFTITLAATDKIRVQTRRLVGGASSTNGGNGSMWRLTRLT